MLKFREILVDTDGKTTTPGEEIIISSGKWIVLEMQLWDGSQRLTKFHFFGAEPLDVAAYLEEVKPHDQGQDRWYYLVADKPFAVISSDPDGYDYEWFDFAEQIHGAKEGRKKWQAPHPRFTAGPRGWRWVKIDDLATFLGMQPVDLWDVYSNLRSVVWEDRQYIAHDSGKATTGLEAIVGSLSDGQTVELKFSLPWSERRARHSQDVWVPAGWAMDMCRLKALGYRPTK